MADQAPNILDTWPRYIATCADSLGGPDAFLDSWYERYMSRWPSLRSLFLRDYAEQRESWRELGATWIYPAARDRFSAMAKAHACLLKIIPTLDARYRAMLRGRAAMRYVVCVDMGFAGWAGRHSGHRVVFIGLAQIARLGWHRTGTLTDLVAHELGHHAHQTLRRRARLAESVGGPIGQLYGEGFAQRVGHLLGGGRWHQASGDWHDWLGRCKQRLPELAARFLQTLSGATDVRQFFGDWLDIDGLSMTGYYLGYRLIRSLEQRGMSLSQVARLNASDLQARGTAFLCQEAGMPNHPG